MFCDAYKYSTHFYSNKCISDIIERCIEFNQKGTLVFYRFLTNTQSLMQLSREQTLQLWYPWYNWYVCVSMVASFGGISGQTSVDWLGSWKTSTWWGQNWHLQHLICRCCVVHLGFFNWCFLIHLATGGQLALLTCMTGFSPNPPISVLPLKEENYLFILALSSIRISLLNSFDTQLQ